MDSWTKITFQRRCLLTFICMKIWCLKRKSVFETYLQTRYFSKLSQEIVKHIVWDMKTFFIVSGEGKSQEVAGNQKQGVCFWIIFQKLFAILFFDKFWKIRCADECHISSPCPPRALSMTLTDVLKDPSQQSHTNCLEDGVSWGFRQNMCGKKKKAKNIFKKFLFKIKILFSNDWLKKFEEAQVNNFARNNKTALLSINVLFYIGREYR